jgi:hypothetical protein
VIIPRYDRGPIRWYNIHLHHEFRVAHVQPKAIVKPDGNTAITRGALLRTLVLETARKHEVNNHTNKIGQFKPKKRPVPVDTVDLSPRKDILESSLQPYTKDNRLTEVHCLDGFSDDMFVEISSDILQLGNFRHGENRENRNQNPEGLSMSISDLSD